jgi:hypothetical protein
MQQAINKVESVIYRGSVQCNVHSDSIIARNFLLIRRVLTDRNMQLHLHVARAGTCDVDNTSDPWKCGMEKENGRKQQHEDQDSRASSSREDV